MDGGDASAGGFRGCAGPPPDKTIINRIMLRFRPIAPKPATTSAGSGASKAPDPKSGFVGLGKRKRRYVRVSASKRNSNSTRRQNSSKGKKQGSRSDRDEPKTQRLVPDELGYPPAGNTSSQWAVKEASGLGEEGRDLGPLDLNMAEIQQPVVTSESWVTVLSLTDTCMEGGELGCTDEDRWRNLEADSFPGFISDADNQVVWSNAAYRKMVVGGREEVVAAKVAVTLVVKELLPLMICRPAFACMVRVQYTWQQENDGEDGRKWRSSGVKTIVVPCDVWRMSYGGFAWRLDLKAGLSLGL